MFGGDLEGLSDGGGVDSEGIGGRSELEELIFERSDGSGGVGEDEFRDWEEAVLEGLAASVECDWIFRRCGGRRRRR